MANRKVSIKDVAKAAGVSVTTVSMVLSEKGRISSETAEKVNQAIICLSHHSIIHIENDVKQFD